MPDPYRKELLTARNRIHLGFLLWFLCWFPVVFSFGFLTVRILAVRNVLEFLTAALPQGIPYRLAVSRNYNYS